MSGELKIVVFGASSGGCFALKRLPKSYEPIAFADNDVNKQGERMLGLPILSAESALDLGPDRIVVASMYAEEISQQLIALGYSSELIEQVETVRTRSLPQRGPHLRRSSGWSEPTNWAEGKFSAMRSKCRCVGLKDGLGS